MKPKAKRPKYNARRVRVEIGEKMETFDSQAEFWYYRDVVLPRYTRGEITALRLHPTYELQPGFRYNGRAVRALKYEADFEYLEGDDLVVVDFKGAQTAEFKLKAKLFKYQHPDLRFEIVDAREWLRALHTARPRRRRSTTNGSQPGPGAGGARRRRPGRRAACRAGKGSGTAAAAHLVQRTRKRPSGAE